MGLVLLCSCDDGSQERCLEFGQSSQPLSVEDRTLVGAPGEYQADSDLRKEMEDLASSQRSRRQRAWQILEQILSPMALAIELPSLEGGNIPLFQSWHGGDDLTRIFRRLYVELSDEQRQRRSRFTSENINNAWEWNNYAISDFASWSEERFSAYVNAIDDSARQNGIGGLARVSYSPAASWHLLRSYPEILACATGEKRVSPAEETNEAESCNVVQDQSKPGCLVDAFPPGSVIVKASFRRANVGIEADAFDTSGPALQRRLSKPEPAWDKPEAYGSPSESEAYTLRLSNGNAYWLMGLHVMTKELDDWFWLTMWWSPEPDSDFGADRPDSIPSPFDNYKLCTVVDFSEYDSDPLEGFNGSHPTTLGAALAATYEGHGGPTWCSNPYIETDPGGAETNCLGCHQHADQNLIADSQQASAPGRLRTQGSRDSDYVFVTSADGDFGRMLVETEQILGSR